MGSENTKFIDVLGLSTILLCTILQLPAFTTHLEIYFTNELIPAVYVIRILPIIFLLYILIFKWDEYAYRREVLYSIPILIYALFDLNGATSFSELLDLVARACYTFSLLWVGALTASRVGSTPCIWEKIGYVLVFAGCLQLLAEMMTIDRFVAQPNIFLLIGALLCARSCLVKLGIVVIWSALAWYDENRTFVGIGLLVGYLSMLDSSIFFRRESKFVTLIFIGAMTFFAALYDGEQWWTESLLTGRSMIWKYWLDYLFVDPLDFLLGIGIGSKQFAAAVQFGVRQEGFSLINQFHNGYIAMSVRGGLLLVLFFVAFSYLLIQRSSENKEAALLFYSIITLGSLNGVSEYFSPNAFGLLLICSLVIM